MSAAVELSNSGSDELDGPSNPLLAANQSENPPPVRKKRLLRYSILLVVSLMIVWGATISFLIWLPPEFKSNWTLVIPGTGTGSSLNLDNIGQTSTSVNSAYATSRVDPKVNYKAIALSRNVLQAAAESHGISLDEFGRPKIKLIDQTTLLEFTTSGNTAESAYQKSLSHHLAFQAELTKLRDNELRTRRDGTTSVLAAYQSTVEQAQAALLAYKSQSAVVSTDQLKQIGSNIKNFI